MPSPTSSEMNPITVLIALGGNALAPRGESGTIYQQFAHTRESLEGIMHFVRRGNNLCLTHGNGPQVGDELLRMELTHAKVPPLPLGVCVAGTQGTIGYMIQQSLQNALKMASIEREVVTLITQVVVDPEDQKTVPPTKFIGHRYPAAKARELARKFNWQIAEEDPGEWRRVVSSPAPRYIMHGRSIKTLVDNGIIVVASGGGGIPVYYDREGNLEGTDAVIDKDLSSALLGRVIKAQELWIITDIDQVYLNYQQPGQQPIRAMTTAEAEEYLQKGHFHSGSMEPKIQAALYFLDHGGNKVVITSNVPVALRGQAGTTLRKGS